MSQQNEMINDLQKLFMSKKRIKKNIYKMRTGLLPNVEKGNQDEVINHQFKTSNQYHIDKIMEREADEKLLTTLNPDAIYGQSISNKLADLQDLSFISPQDVEEHAEEPPKQSKPAMQDNDWASTFQTDKPPQESQELLEHKKRHLSIIKTLEQYKSKDKLPVNEIKNDFEKFKKQIRIK